MQQALKVQVEHEMPYLLRAFNDALTDGTDALIASYGLTKGQLKYIFNLRAGPLTQRDLVGYLRLDKATVARAVADLTAAGMVASGRQGRERLYPLYLTPRGQEVCEALTAHMNERIARAFAGVSDRDVASMLRVMRQVAVNCDQTAADDLTRIAAACTRMHRAEP